MKKVININFQGRVVPIEETAYDLLKQYVESLRNFFSNEEGRDEIINDIEGRIAELFSETLKKGSTCISDADVNTIINSMGRPEDFEDEETKVQSQLGSESGKHQKQQAYASASSNRTDASPRGRLYRDENDKLLGGVCGGLANYLRMDSSIIRILFAIITFGGFGAGFLLYILMWILLPSKSLDTQTRKRLYRNPDDKVVAGVASGIAAYFNISVWVPRLIFGLPLILGVITSVFQNVFFHFNPFPSIIFGSFGSSLFIIYIVLWAVIPQAGTASEKLEMRGEKVDLNTIKNTIQGDLENFKGRAEKFGEEIKEKAGKFSSEFKETVEERSREAAPVIKRTGSRLGNAIGIIFKGFFLLIAGIIAFALLMAMLGIMIGGVSVFPLKDFFLDGFWQNILAWGTLLLFLAVPVIALIIWLIRRLIGVKSKNPYLGYIFGGLWVIGLVSVICLAASITGDYRTKAGIPEKINMAQPSNNKLLVKVSHDLTANYYGSDWYGIDWDDDAPFYGISKDSFLVRTVQVRIIKSSDSAFHLSTVKLSRGSSPEIAKGYANKIVFNVAQVDSILTLPQGFTLTREQKFRNQQVLLLIEVPMGKKIEMDKTLGNYHWFNIEFGNNYNERWSSEWDEDWTNNYDWKSNVEYIMTKDGLKRVDGKNDNADRFDEDNSDANNQLENIQKQKQDLEKKEEEIKNSIKQDSARYHYQLPADTSKITPVKPEEKKIETKVQAEIKIESPASPSTLLQRFSL